MVDPRARAGGIIKQGVGMSRSEALSARRPQLVDTGAGHVRVKDGIAGDRGHSADDVAFFGLDARRIGRDPGLRAAQLGRIAVRLCDASRTVAFGESVNLRGEMVVVIACAATQSQYAGTGQGASGTGKRSAHGPPA